MMILLSLLGLVLCVVGMAYARRWLVAVGLVLAAPMTWYLYIASTNQWTIHSLAVLSGICLLLALILVLIKGPRSILWTSLGLLFLIQIGVQLGVLMAQAF
ncbi:MAG: hypothetical protein KM310_02340 [Clostridiales bacterium]|nr:hypothetical protein [Clostridiales bacterium]